MRNPPLFDLSYWLGLTVIVALVVFTIFGLIGLVEQVLLHITSSLEALV